MLVTVEQTGACFIDIVAGFALGSSLFVCPDLSSCIITRRSLRFSFYVVLRIARFHKRKSMKLYVIIISFMLYLYLFHSFLFWSNSFSKFFFLIFNTSLVDTEQVHPFVIVAGFNHSFVIVGLGLSWITLPLKRMIYIIKINYNLYGILKATFTQYDFV